MLPDRDQASIFMDQVSEQAQLEREEEKDPAADSAADAVSGDCP